MEFIGTNYSPGKLIISASVGGYTNTNYIVDNVRHGASYTNDNRSASTTFITAATNGLLASGVSSNAIIFADGLDEITNGIRYDGPHLTNAVNVAGYISWGAHSALDNEYALPGATVPVKWQGSSSWWIIETVESFNGQPGAGQGDFFQWFSSNAFGGTNYSNTPIGAVTHVEEPGLSFVENSSVYFGLWANGKNFSISAWNSRKTPYFQAIGDPFITR